MNRCCVRVFGDTFNGYMCRKNAKVERNGKWYCGIHDPIAVEARIEKRNSAWQQKYAAEKEQREAPAIRIAALESEIERNRVAIAELVDALKYIMEWQVKNVDKWDNRAYDFGARAIAKHDTSTKSEQID